MGFLYPAAPPPARWPWSSVGYVLSLATRSSVQHNEGTFSPHAFVFLLQSLQIYQDSVINPTILPIFFAKEPLFAVFSYTIAEILCPVPCPTEVWCPIHHRAYRGVMPQHRYGDGMRCLMTRPTARQKTHGAAWAYAARCDGKCNALHGHMHRTAFSGAELRGFGCSGPRV